MTSDPQLPVPTDDPDDATLVVEEPRFAIVAEWVIDAAVSDAAFRLYCLLLRYGNGSGTRMSSRPTLARRLRRSVDAVDRAMRQLSDAGIVRIEHRRSGEQFFSNRYHVRTSAPAPSAPDGGGRVSAATPGTAAEGGRVSAATPVTAVEGGHLCAATPGRTSAARVAADVRPDREIFTERTPPPPPSPDPTPGVGAPTPPTPVEVADQELLARCGITDLPALAQRCAASRRALGRPTARWTARCLMVVIRLAVVGKGWPPAAVGDALLVVAHDPETRSPARVVEAGPWWDAAIVDADLVLDARELADLEWRLSETGGLRPLLQARARTELAQEGLPRTRATVAQRACLILERHEAGDPTRQTHARALAEAGTHPLSHHDTPEGITR